MTMELNFCIDRKCIFLIKDTSYDCGYVCEFKTEICPLEYDCSHTNILEKEEIKIHDVVRITNKISDEYDVGMKGKVIDIDGNGQFTVDFKDIEVPVGFLPLCRNSVEIILRRVK